MQGELDAVIGEQTAAQERPRPFSRLWPFLMYSFTAAILCEALLALSNAHAFIVFKSIAEGSSVSQINAAFVDLHQALIGILYFAVMIASVIAYCRFYYRAMKNLTIINAADLRMTPLWSVGSFFVPIVNLWKPLGAVRQIWRGSFDPATADVKVPAMIGWWWFFWLVSNWLGNISFRLGLQSGAFGSEIVDYDAYLGSLMIDMASAPFSIASAILVLRFSGRIKSAQDQNVLQ